MSDRIHDFWNFKGLKLNETVHREKMIIKINSRKVKVSSYELKVKEIERNKIR